MSNISFKYHILGLFFALFAQIHCCLAQFVENFSDGNFTENPAWQGDQDLFVVNTVSELQLNDINISNNEAFLAVSAPTGVEATWSFHVSLDFSPSASNFCRIYLNADQDDLTESLNGFFVQIGGISGDQDALELVRQVGNDMTTLISGTPGEVANEPVEVSVLVSRNTQGLWNLQADYSGGQNFIDEGTATDASFPEGQFFGIVCNYTSTRNDAFRLDDISIDPIFEDLNPPSLVNLEIVNSAQLQLNFSEAIDFSLLSENNFQLDNGITVSGISSDPTSENIVLLNLSPSLENGTTYNLVLQDISDLAGNVLMQETQSFTFTETFIAQEFDLLINEFMADPIPQVGLPNAEYVELFNNSSNSLQLSDYTIQSGGSPTTLPSFILMPGEYVIITSDDEVGNFNIFGDALGLSSFPTLTNSGDEISIQDLEGNVIHEINYTLDWYQDSSKEDGGFSIEIINPSLACKGQPNYIASTNLSGGTPGVVNSVLESTTDETAPSLLNIFTIDESNILLIFDEPINQFGAEEVLNYSITDNLAVQEATLQPDKMEVLLNLINPIQAGMIFGLQYQNISDCIGNTAMLSDTLFFSLPDIASEGDLLINEILFNPVSNGVDYVEIYNASNQVFNLADLQIGNTVPEINEFVSINIDFLIFPETYVCISEDRSKTIAQYEPEDEATIFENALPSFADDQGNITLATLQDNNAVIIDEFDYSEDFHTGFLSDDNGVSLERISFDSPTNIGDNWTSAAQSTNFGTPGFVNSQVIINPNIASEDFFEIVNPTFSPDQDGFKDFTQINFILDQVDYFASMTIYDDEGREIKQLFPFQTIAPSGTVTWDGTDNDGNVSNIGIYILLSLIHI